MKDNRMNEMEDDDDDDDNDVVVEENPEELDSINHLKQNILNESNNELRNLIKQSVYIGYVNPKYSLLQFNTSLFIVNFQLLR
jgi:hypothetical protein